MWKAHHSKLYSSAAEEEHRYNVWLDNKAYVDEHNSQADELGYSLKMNSFGDKVSTCMRRVHDDVCMRKFIRRVHEYDKVNCVGSVSSL